MKLLLKLIGWLLLFVVVAAVAFVVLFDPNEYKAEIEQQVQQATGRTLDIGGDIGLSILPIGLELGQVELSNAPGFEQPVFARIESLVIKAKLIPLLQQRLEVDALQLDGLRLFLEVDSDGRNNWQDLAGDKAEEVQPEQEQPADAGDDDGPPLAALAVNGIDISGAHIRYDDRRQGSSIRVSELSLTTGNIEFGEAFDFAFSADVSQKTAEVEQSAAIELASSVTVQQDLKRFSFEQIVLAVKANLPQVQPQVMELGLRADAAVDLQAETARLSNAAIDAMQVKLQLDAEAANWSETLKVSGTLVTEELDPRRLAERFAAGLPPMQGPNAMSKLKLTLPFSLQGNAVAAQPKIVFDDSNIDGDVRLALDSRALRFDIAIDSIDVNRYLPPPSQDPPPEAAADEVPEQDLPIPAELLRSLDVAGTLTIGSLRALEYDISELSLTTTVKDGIAELSPLSLQLLEGSIEAHSRLDVRKEVPQLAQKLSVANLQIGAFADPIVAGLVPSQQINVKGSTRADVDVTTSGTRISQFRQNLAGSIVLDMQDIIADGLDTEYLMFTTVADFTSSQKLAEKIGLPNQYRPKTETAFHVIHAGFDIERGVMRTQDLNLDADHIDITGKGKVDIMAETMDMNIVSDLTLYKVSSVTDKLADEPLPVHVHGSWFAPVIDVDYGPMKQRFKTEYIDKVKNKLDAQKAAAQQKLDEQKAAAQQKLDEKTDAKVEEKKDEVKDKLQDKLKGLFR